MLGSFRSEKTSRLKWGGISRSQKEHKRKSKCRSQPWRREGFLSDSGREMAEVRRESGSTFVDGFDSYTMKVVHM